MAESKPLEGLTVLIVEDEFLIAMDAQRIVEDAGASQTILANSIVEARRALAGSGRIDVCMLDLKLRAEDGLGLVADLRERGIAIVIATGFAGTAQIGDAQIVRKPYHDAEVVNALVAAKLGGRCEKA